jgi:hypothetical protein
MLYPFNSTNQGLTWTFFNNADIQCFTLSFYSGNIATDTLYLAENYGLLYTKSIPTGWLSLEIEWYNATSSLKVRYKPETGVWTDWRTASCSNNVKRLNIEDGDVNMSTEYYIFFDSFSQGTGYGLCGANLDCVFCGNQTDCENNNCLWITDWTNTGYFTNCVPKVEPIISEVASSTINATTFYNDFCNYSAPTSLYLGLTNLTGGFISYLSSWLSNFSNFFDLTQAQEKGTILGQAIPKARGYLDNFNSIFGDIPIGEIFILYLTIYIAIIIFRIARHIKGLLPFQ